MCGPPRFSNLTPLDFHEDKVHENNPHILEELKDSIRKNTASISHRELQQVASFLKQVPKMFGTKQQADSESPCLVWASKRHFKC